MCCKAGPKTVFLGTVTRYILCGDELLVYFHSSEGGVKACEPGLDLSKQER